MSLASTLRRGVALAESITRTGGLQEAIQHAAWTGADGYGKPTYATAVTLYGIVEHGSKATDGVVGIEQVQETKLIFLDPVTANGTAGREEPFDRRDLITLLNGTTSPIKVSVSGVSDPTTGVPYAHEVTLGAAGS